MKYPPLYKTRYSKILGDYEMTGSMYQAYARMPEIRLKGFWLGQYGFFPDRKIKITVRREVLIIQPIPKENEVCEKLKYQGKLTQ